MPDWVGNLFLTSGTGITLTKPDTVGHGGTTIAASGSSGGGLADWSALTTYTVGQTAIDRGGIWKATGTSLNSRPISGNTNWTLVAGTPYVDVTLDPTALTTAPFFDAIGAGPGLEILAAPGANKVLQIIRAWSSVSAGTAWGTKANALIYYESPAGNETLFAGINDQLTVNLTNTLGWVWADSASAPKPGLTPSFPAVNKSIVIWTTNDVSSGGTGTRSLFYRFWYDIIPTQ